MRLPSRGANATHGVPPWVFEIPPTIGPAWKRASGAIRRTSASWILAWFVSITPRPVARRRYAVATTGRPIVPACGDRGAPRHLLGHQRHRLGCQGHAAAIDRCEESGAHVRRVADVGRDEVGFSRHRPVIGGRNALEPSRDLDRDRIELVGSKQIDAVLASLPRSSAPAGIGPDEGERAIAVGRLERPGVDPLGLVVRVHPPDPHVQRVDLRGERDSEPDDRSGRRAPPARSRRSSCLASWSSSARGSAATRASRRWGAAPQGSRERPTGHGP